MTQNRNRTHFLNGRLVITCLALETQHEGLKFTADQPIRKELTYVAQGILFAAINSFGKQRIIPDVLSQKMGLESRFIVVKRKILVLKRLNHCPGGNLTIGQGHVDPPPKGGFNAGRITCQNDIRLGNRCVR